MDTRTRREKLAAMAAQTVSPEEARVAAAKLASTPPPRTLTRDAILGTRDERRVVGSERHWDRSRRAYVVVDVAEILGRRPEDLTFVESDLPPGDYSSPFDWDGVE